MMTEFGRNIQRTALLLSALYPQSSFALLMKPRIFHAGRQSPAMVFTFHAASTRLLLHPSPSSTFSLRSLCCLDRCLLMVRCRRSWKKERSLEGFSKKIMHRACAAAFDSLGGVGSGGESEEESEEMSEEDLVASTSPERWDAIGLGQAMVDFSGMVDDEFLERLAIEKGARKVVNHEERGRVLRAMDGCSYKAAAGGSLSNTLVALARLGSHSIIGDELNVAMTGSVGSDPLGEFYRAKLRRANVDFLSKPVKDGTTGTVIVLTTPDAQRTMLAYPGTSSTIDYDPWLASLVSKTRVLIIEGYLLELPHTIETICKACEESRRNGALIAVTTSDVSCIERSYGHFWEIIGNYADIIFSNTNEARAVCNLTSKDSPISAARYLSHFVPLVSVTDGPRGSYIGVKGEAVYIPAYPCVPMDTCGAGDAYASGILYGILRGVSDVKGMGMLASRVAAVVVAQQGTRLRVQNASRLVKLFAHQLQISSFCSDVESDHMPSC